MLRIDGDEPRKIERPGHREDFRALLEEAVEAARRSEHPVFSGALVENLEFVRDAARHEYEGAAPDVRLFAADPEAILPLDDQKQFVFPNARTDSPSFA
ncbi:MAG: hypothetical protein ABI889_14585 [Gemmatimonadota bacterium]